VLEYVVKTDLVTKDPSFVEPPSQNTTGTSQKRFPTLVFVSPRGFTDEEDLGVFRAAAVDMVSIPLAAAVAVDHFGSLTLGSCTTTLMPSMIP
jgi:hypothetical protein